MPTIIPLNKGFWAVVDDDDMELVTGIKWRVWEGQGQRYACATMRIDGRRKNVAMHRFILGAGPSDRIDHWDGDGLNNQRDNFRYVTRGQNKSNSHKRALASSPLKGVRKNGLRWRAQISAREFFETKPWFIGDFETETDAGLAYDAVARIVFGKFARVNFPRPGEQGAVPGIEADPSRSRFNRTDTASPLDGAEA